MFAAVQYGGFGRYYGFGGYGSFGGGYLGQFFFYLDQMGILDVILPFILIFTVTFAMLQKIGLFIRHEKVDGKAGDKWDPDSVAEARKYNAVISLCIGLLVVVPHVLGYYPPDQDAVMIINNIVPNFSIAALAVVFALILAGIGIGKTPNTISYLVSGGAVVFLGYVIYRAFNYNSMPPWLPFANDPYLLMFIITILVVGGILYAVMSTPDYEINSDGSRGNRRSTYQTLERLFRGS